MKTLLLMLAFSLPLCAKPHKSLFTDKPVIGLFAVDLTAKLLDSHITESHYELAQSSQGSQSFQELDSLERPLLGHPVALYSAHIAYAMGAAWIGHRLRFSNNKVLRTLWWVPQSISIGNNVYGYQYSRTHWD